MPFNPFTSVTGRNALTLFDIRLENDFLVFRGSEHEASGQLLKGVLAICVPSPIKVEDIHLRLTGVQRLTWTDPRVTPTSGLTNTKVDRTNIILQHQWPPFWGTPGKSAILEKGNYEFPFELMLGGDTSESVEGLNEASITYKLKATIARGKLAYDLHAYKHLRVVRTVEPSALEFLHAMSVENIWPNKVEYSIVVPQKAVVFGSHIPLESRFTPLLKGLELGDISIRLMEVHDFVSVPASNASGFNLGMREHKHERLVSTWTVNASREEHWQEMIEDTGQEGWVVNTSLDLPRKLSKCIQDVNVHGIKVRHKLKMVVALKNPDGHVSELRATLPLSIFISPNIPLDEQGNLTCPSGTSASADGFANTAPPGYGEHVLDQLYDDMDVHNLQTPAPLSTVHSPMYGLSRAGSSENLAAATASVPVPPAALTSRLQDVSSREAVVQRNRGSTIVTPPGSSSDLSSLAFTPAHPSHSHRSGHISNGPSVPVSRRNSNESHRSEHSDPEHIDYASLSELCKVPSYATAMKNPRVGPISTGDNLQLPDYRTITSRSTFPMASSASATASSAAAGAAAPANTTSGSAAVSAGEPPLPQIAETSRESLSRATTRSADAVDIRRPQRAHTAARARTESDVLATGRRSLAVSFGHSRHVPQNGDSDERSWLHLLQARGRVAT
ncbi:carbon catabolite repression protein [Niveomyces insectorum RCEF 264]|uniref:Carbon catabolite repression protein n=1 Tax=Niveomyces insectorum RCEF 264 TaxID=1081102 RepID=A0A167TY31_9HYPO|nr:carbon catabolite repression protein [Niveomyces insectorum RCEF 264]